MDATGGPKEGSGKKFEIKRWNAVALWAWDIQTDVCSICRGQLMEPCNFLHNRIEIKPK